MAEPDISSTDGPARPRRADGPDHTAPPLAVMPGTGQLTRCGAVIAFATTPFPPLADAVAPGTAGLGDRLAALVARSDPAPPPFVVLDLTTPASYRFGALHLGPVIVAPHDGSDDGGGGQARDIVTARQPGPDGSARLVGPVPIDPAIGIRCQIDATSAPVPGTDLQGGTVPAGGFALAPDPLAARPTPPAPSDDSVAPPADDTATQTPTVVAVHAPPPTQPPSWDPLADPEGIDLATLGTTRRRALPVPTPSVPSPAEPADLRPPTVPPPLASAPDLRPIGCHPDRPDRSG